MNANDPFSQSRGLRKFWRDMIRKPEKEFFYVTQMNIKRLQAVDEASDKFMIL